MSEKPILYLPTRALLVPCTYTPKSESIEYHQYVFGFKIVPGGAKDEFVKSVQRKPAYMKTTIRNVKRKTCT